MVYVGDRNALNELIGYYDGLKQGIEELKRENIDLQEQLENKAYNELKTQLEVYKNRIDKAIKHIEKNKDLVDWIHCLSDDLLKILKGDSNE